MVHAAGMVAVLSAVLLDQEIKKSTTDWQNEADMMLKESQTKTSKQHNRVVYNKKCLT